MDNKVSFSYFLEQFPVMELPITLRPDSYVELATNSDPLPSLMIEQYIMDDDEEEDGMTEYIACCRLPQHDNYETIIYWRAGLMSYEYIMKTYTKDGLAVIDSQTVAGTIVHGENMVESVATIQEDRIVYIATGASNLKDNSFDTTTNKVSHLEIHDDGTIIVT